jgi:hypothetical protein
MTHDPNVNAAHGGPVAPPEQRHWGPGGPSAKSELIERWTPSTSIGWRAYHKSFFPPGGLVTPWIRFKVMSTGVNVARRLWDQREELRAAYEVEHGSDPLRVGGGTAIWRTSLTSGETILTWTPVGMVVVD